MTYIEEKVEEFDKLTDETWLISQSMGTVKHQQKAWLRTTLTEVDRRARESEREKMREEEDTYNENTLNA